MAAASTREDEITCGDNSRSSGLQQLKDPLEITHHEQDRPREKQDIEQAWSPCQDDEYLDPPHIRVETFTSSSPLKVTDHVSMESSVCDEEKSRDGEREGYKLSNLSLSALLLAESRLPCISMRI
ncbi:hypothetical protein PAMP_017037 [Pampus punctatissimus]